MKLFKSLKETKIERKQFLYASGLLVLGGFLLAKFPVRFVSRRAENILNAGKIQVRENPESVKRQRTEGTAFGVQEHINKKGV